ncbi:MAG: hydroxyethylthiazole kinase [Proteobacteria bacterium]|nr:hydroxyethylthiazole kinase [Pseudomonadota bacterium]
MDIITHTRTCLAKIKKTSPLIHNITNFVVMNSSANILLALGASPVMAHAKEEVNDMAALAGALVLNIGTLQEDWVDAMIRAGKAANEKKIPVILDPVGAGATSFRTLSVKRIMDECKVSVLRGNASEILSLVDSSVKTKGVDSSIGLTDNMVETFSHLASQNKMVVAVSGEVDCITDGTQVFRVKNGHPLMTRVTGIGCGLSAVVGAFCAVMPEDLACTTAAALGFYGLCGEVAARINDKPGSFYTAFVDCLYTVGPGDIQNCLRVYND